MIDVYWTGDISLLYGNKFGDIYFVELPFMAKYLIYEYLLLEAFSIQSIFENLETYREVTNTLHNIVIKDAVIYNCSRAAVCAKCARSRK